MSNNEIASSHSFCSPTHPKETLQNTWKSDIFIPGQLNKTAEKCSAKVSMKDCCGEYYKKYEHDEVPVKDSEGTGDRNCLLALTNSQLDELEYQVLKDISQDLEIKNGGDSCTGNLDPNIKFFKITCQQIFDTFYATMQDIELYKQRFQDILEKNKSDSSEMEEFLKEMFQHLTSTESFQGEKLKSSENEESTCKESLASKSNELLSSVVESYRNENYMTDSNTEETYTSKPRQMNTGEVFNIYLGLGNTPYVEIKMNDRSMLSEINIKREPTVVMPAASSAENLKKLLMKKKQMEVDKEDKPELHCEIEIPIRGSTAKKNIHLDEDFCGRGKNEKSFLSRICGYFCKRFRKNV